jgi:hypothetical protein
MEEPRKMKIIEIRPVLGERVDAAFFHREPTVITKNDKPRAILASYEQWLQQNEELATYRAKYGPLEGK